MKLYLLVCYAFFAIALLILFSCQMATEPETEIEKQELTKMIIYFDFDYTIPASPGAIDSSIVFSSRGQYAGILSPLLQPQYPLNTGAVLTGCSLNSGIVIKKFRWDSFGIVSLRPSLPVAGVFSGLIAEMSRVVTFGSNVNSSFYAPLANLGEWIDSGAKYDIYGQITPKKLPYFSDASFTTKIDTRNLQSIYYGTSGVLRLSMEVDCVVE